MTDLRAPGRDEAKRVATEIAMSTSQAADNRRASAPNPSAPAAASGHVAKCDLCSEGRDRPSPLDPGQRRAWSPGSRATTCAWCKDLREILHPPPEDGMSTMAHLVNPNTNLLQAMFTLRLEGTSTVTIADLNTRFGILKKVSGFFTIAPPSSSSRGSTMCPKEMISTAASSTMSDDLSSMSTPKKTDSAGSNDLDDAASTSSALASAPRHVKIETDTTSAALSSPTTSSHRGAHTPRFEAIEAATPTSLGDTLDDFEDIADDELADISSRTLPAMSLDLRFPFQGFGGPLTRIKGTINDYVLKLAAEHWMEEFMAPTVAALARRLVSHTADIDGTMHMEAVAAFKSLKARVSYLILLYRSIDNWTRSQNDALLANVLRYMRGLDPVLAHFGCKMASDLSIVRARAVFQVELTTNSRVLKAPLCSTLYFGATSPALAFGSYP